MQNLLWNLPEFLFPGSGTIPNIETGTLQNPPETDLSLGSWLPRKLQGGDPKAKAVGEKYLAKICVVFTLQFLDHVRDTGNRDVEGQYVLKLGSTNIHHLCEKLLMKPILPWKGGYFENVLTNLLCMAEVNRLR